MVIFSQECYEQVPVKPFRHLLGDVAGCDRKSHFPLIDILWHVNLVKLRQVPLSTNEKIECVNVYIYIKIIF